MNQSKISTTEQMTQQVNGKVKQKWKKPEVFDIELNDTEGAKLFDPSAETTPTLGPS